MRIHAAVLHEPRQALVVEDVCILAGENGPHGVLMDGTSRLALPDGTPLQHALMTACFAERAVVAAAGAVPLPPGLPLWQASLLGCGVVTTFGAVRNAARVQPGESAVVVGCGGVGLQLIAVEPLDAVNVALDRPRRGEGTRTVLIVDETLAATERARAA